MKSLALMFLFCVPAAAADQGISKYQEKVKSTPSSELLKLAAKRKSFAVEELGRRREKSAIPLLEEIAEEPDKLSGVYMLTFAELSGINLSHREARIALARMGQEKYFDPFIVGLSTTNGVWRIECMRALARIGDPKAVPSLLPILDDVHRPRPFNPELTVPQPTYAQVAEDALTEILPGAEGEIAKETGHDPTRADWERWLKAHPGRVPGF